MPSPKDPIKREEWRRKLSQARTGSKLDDAKKQALMVSTECVRCGKTIESFLGRKKYCDECKILVRGEIDKRYRERNKERIRQRRIEARRKNPEKFKAAYEKWRLANLDKVAARVKAWRDANPGKSRETARNSYWRNWDKRKQLRDQRREELRERNKNWRRANLEKDAAKSRRHYAKKRGATGSHTLEEFLEVCEQYSWRCFYCGCQLDRSTVTEDHVVPVSEGGTDNIDNIVPACRSCNSRKGDKSLEEFLALYGIRPWGEVI